MPIITIWVGVFPMVVNFWMALGSTIYIAANCSVLYYAKDPRWVPYAARAPLLLISLVALYANFVSLHYILERCALGGSSPL